MFAGDKNVQVREKAVKFIEQLRENETPTAPQDFILPEINVNASTYYKMITYQTFDNGKSYYFKASKRHGQEVHRNLSNRRVTEPPITRHLSIAELYDFIINPMRTSYLCHSQPCERGVKLTSDSCRTKTGYTTQLGIALQADRARKENKRIEALKF